MPEQAHAGLAETPEGDEMIFSDSELKLTPEARAIQAIVQICDTVSLKTKHEVLVAVRDFAIDVIFKSLSDTTSST